MGFGAGGLAVVLHIVLRAYGVSSGESFVRSSTCTVDAVTPTEATPTSQNSGLSRLYLPFRRTASASSWPRCGPVPGLAGSCGPRAHGYGCRVRTGSRK